MQIKSPLFHAISPVIAAATVAAASLIASPASAADDDEFLADATLEELDEAGYIIHGNKDFAALAVNLQHAMDVRADAVADLWIAAVGPELAEIAALGDLLSVTDSLEMIEVIPAPTGQPGTPAIIIGLDDLSSGPDLGGLSAGFPSKHSLASFKLILKDQYGSIWGQQTESGNGYVKVTERHYDPTGSLVAVVVIETSPDGTVRGSVTYADEPGTSVTETTEDEEVLSVEPVTPEEVITPVQPDEVPMPKGKIAGLPPVDDGGSYCPLFIPACRDALEEAQEQAGSATYLVSAFIYVDPGPDGAVESLIAPLIVDDPEPFATNPDPNAMSGEYGSAPAGFAIEFPVAVLPPKPNT